METPSPDWFAELLATAVPRRRRLAAAHVPNEPLAWLSLTPAWPLSLAMKGFPGPSGRLTGEAVSTQLEEFEAAGVVQSQPGELPFDETWFTMTGSQRANAIAELTRATADDAAYLERQLLAAGKQLTQAAGGIENLPPALERWAELAVSDPQTRATLVETRVREALARARSEKALSCPEARRWIETAEPLAALLGGPLPIEVARANRRLELFHRQARDLRLLDNYLEREDIEKPFLDLALGSGPAWALHYIGLGGMGKTMLMRHIKTQLASEHGITTARVDFDTLNPDYPRRYPGFLLMGFAEELRLSDDPDIAGAFGRFDQGIRAVHEKMESVARSGNENVTAGIDAALERAKGAFVEGLKIIAERSRPVLILDTCEELAKIRSDNNLPLSLLKTFEMLEYLHGEVPSLRVVFSGRRLLARKGMDWEIPDSPLPERLYMRLVEIPPLTGREAHTFLEQYREGNASVAADLWPAILGQTSAPHVSILKQVQWTPPRPAQDDEVRHNPYDMDLYASWACGDDKVTSDVISKGAHVYVRERIAGRLKPAVRELLAVLTVLGRFDREMIRALTTAPDQAFDGLWDEIIDQEWIEIDRGARTAGEVWGMVPNLRQRVEAFLRTHDAGSWAAAREQIRPVLGKLTISRDWRELTPSYFAVALDLLNETPVAAADWWADVERKIVRDGSWDWARNITDLLLDVEGPAGTGAVAGDDEVKPIRAAVLATRAAAMLRLNTDALESTWIAVQQLADRHPTTAGQAVLEFRANAGMIAHVRWRLEPLGEHYVHELDDMFQRVPPLPQWATDEPFDESSWQLIGTELALIENTIEILERVEWSRRPPAGLIGRIRERLKALPNVPKVWRAFAHVLAARLDALAGIVPALSDPDVMVDRAEPVPYLLDWRRPGDLVTRLLLEVARLTRWQSAGSSVDEDSSPPITSIDEDRLRSVWLLTGSDGGVVAAPTEEAIEESLKVAAANVPECHAHRIVPPFFATALEAKAASGDIASAMREAERIASSSRPLDVRLAAERARLRIAGRFRALDTEPAFRTLLDETANLRDAVLVRGVVAFQPARSRSPYRGRWRMAADWLEERGRARQVEASTEPTCSFEQFSLALDAFEEQEPRSRAEALTPEHVDRWRDEHPLAVEEGFTIESRTLALLGNQPPRLPRSDGPLGARRAGEIMLEEGNLLALRAHDRAAWLLNGAVAAFESAGDSTSRDIALVSRSLASARAGDVSGLRRLTLPFGVSPGGLQPKQLLDSWAGPLEMLPWVVRSVACAVRSLESAKAGDLTRELQQWLAYHYREGLPADLDGVLAVPVDDPKHNDVPARAWLRRFSTDNLALVAGLAIFGGVIAGSHYLLTRYGLSSGYFQTALWIVGVPVVVGYLLPQFIRQYVRALAELMKLVVRVEVEPLSPVADPNRPLASSIRVNIRSSSRFSSGRTNSVTLPPTSALSYQEQARLFPRPPALVRWINTLVATQVPPIVGDLIVPENCAAVCWEAIRGIHGAPSILGNPLALRRTSPQREEMRQIPRQPDFHGPAFVQSWSEAAHSRRGLAAGFRTEITKNKRFSFQLVDPEIEPHFESTVVLHVVADAVETSAGLRLRLQESIGPTRAPEIEPEELRSRYPALRLCILQAFPKEITRRMDSDRISAGLMRRAAARLFEVGLPMVIVIPPLPEETGPDVLAALGVVIRDQPVNAVDILTRVVRGAQKMVTKIEGPAPNILLEIAYDMCIYAESGATLHVPTHDRS